ncbi:Fic family protein [uncultured Tessaracoccus sp.]|uniref:Fic family protein n=1 Tax=uncultured Tessaracoccus sp. TaxID=905023 RepID=UPI0025D78566|nr:Fic family protein [uncultured Tessaracoccus sp.]
MPQSWPPISHGQGEWVPQPDALMSRRRRMRNRGTFRYAAPPRIAELPVTLASETLEAARHATSAIERFDAKAERWGQPFASILLRSESASSSQIERLSASARRIALASLGDTGNRNATSIARNVEAMHAAIALADTMDVRAVLAMHKALGGGDDPDHAGRFREEWVWVGGDSPVTAEFVPPPHELVPDAVVDVMRFLARRDVDPLAQAAIAHAQFETIHPFTDGNGRTGRALISAALRHRGVARNLSVPISSGLLTETSTYFHALEKYRAGRPDEIVVAFAEAAELAIVNAQLLRADVEQVREEILATARRRTQSIVRMAELCTAEPAFNIDMAVDAGVTRPTAYRLCRRLTDASLLRRERSVGGVDVWTVVGLTRALDAFASRAGRRQ